MVFKHGIEEVFGDEQRSGRYALPLARLKLRRFHTESRIPLMRCEGHKDRTNQRDKEAERKVGIMHIISVE